MQTNRPRVSVTLLAVTTQQNRLDELDRQLVERFPRVSDAILRVHQVLCAASTPIEAVSMSDQLEGDQLKSSALMVVDTSELAEAVRVVSNLRTLKNVEPLGIMTGSPALFRQALIREGVVISTAYFFHPSEIDEVCHWLAEIGRLNHLPS